MFWDWNDDPRASLRWSLSKLRGLLGIDDQGALIADRDQVRLDPQATKTDWSQLRNLAAGDLGRADAEALRQVVLEESEFLQGLDLPRCDIYQSWLVAMREDVRLWRAQVLRALLQRPIGAEAALPFARALVRLDPLDGQARVMLLDMLEQTGRRTEAEEQRALAIKSLGENGMLVPASLRYASRAAGGPELPPQQIRFCAASDGTSLAYSKVGSGPPLVKAANWLNHLEHDWDSPIWRHWIREITQFRTLVRYDERGNGLSDWNAADISFDAFVDDLSSVIDAAGLDRFDLLGISQGCSVSIAYAVKYPEKVRRLVLYGGYAAGWKVRAKPGEVERREAMMTLTREGWGQNNPAFRQMFSMLFFPAADAAEIEWFNELQRLSTSPENAVSLQQAFADIDVRSLLPLVRVPTLVLHTTEDAIIPFEAGKAIAAGIAGAAFVGLESRNHLLLENEPAWPRAMESIRTFLEND